MKILSFPVNSRYYGFETKEIETRSGKTVTCLDRRFVPPPEKFELLQEHEVSEGDRLDNISAQYLGDPELFWRICDANRAMLPDDLIVIGQRLRITMPEGIPGGING
jgi:hypothetical protein